MADILLRGGRVIDPARNLDVSADLLLQDGKVARIEPALEGADVVMMLRIQLERKAGGRFPNTREYARYFGLNQRRLALAKPDAIVMHPGPMNRGVEISPDVADGPRSVILDQVARGVAVRMAVLYLLGGGSDAVE